MVQNGFVSQLWSGVLPLRLVLTVQSFALRELGRILRHIACSCQKRTWTALLYIAPFDPRSTNFLWLDVIIKHGNTIIATAACCCWEKRREALRRQWWDNFLDWIVPTNPFHYACYSPLYPRSGLKGQLKPECKAGDFALKHPWHELKQQSIQTHLPIPLNSEDVCQTWILSYDPVSEVQDISGLWLVFLRSFQVQDINHLHK